MWLMQWLNTAWQLANLEAVWGRDGKGLLSFILSYQKLTGEFLISPEENICIQ